MEEEDESMVQQEVEISMEEIAFEEDQFAFEPTDGEKLDVYNEKRVYQAEMTQNSKMVLEATRQSQEMLLKQVTQGKEKSDISMTEIQFEESDQETFEPTEGENMEVHNETRINHAAMSSNSKA